MTKEWLSTETVKDITSLIAGCDFPDKTFFLGEQLPAWVVKPAERQNLLLFVNYKPTLPFAEYTSGRIFHRDFELRWKQNDGDIQVVYLGKREHCPPLLQSG